MVGKAAFGLRKPEFVPDQVHQVGGILAVVDGEGGIKSDLLGIFAQQPGANAVEGAGPAQRVGHDAGLVAEHLACDPLDPLRHLGRRAARECHQQDTSRIGAVDDQMGDAMGQRVGLAGARTGDDQQRRPTWPSPDTPCSTARRCSGLSVSRYEAAAGTECWSLGVEESHSVIPAPRTMIPATALAIASALRARECGITKAVPRPRPNVSVRRHHVRLLAADVVNPPNAGPLFNELSQNFRRAVTQV